LTGATGLQNAIQLVTESHPLGRRQVLNKVRGVRFPNGIGLPRPRRLPEIDHLIDPDKRRGIDANEALALMRAAPKIEL